MKVYLDNERPAPPGWQWARTLDQAKAFLRSGRVEQLSLDYDLEGDTKGLSLLEWMKSNNKWPKYSPKVHSGNPIGALKMKSFIAEHAGKLPKAPKARLGRPPGTHGPGHYPRALAQKAKY